MWSRNRQDRRGKRAGWYAGPQWPVVLAHHDESVERACKEPDSPCTARGQGQHSQDRCKNTTAPRAGCWKSRTTQVHAPQTSFCRLKPLSGMQVVQRLKFQSICRRRQGRKAHGLREAFPHSRITRRGMMLTPRATRQSQCQFGPSPSWPRSAGGLLEERYARGCDPMHGLGVPVATGAADLQAGPYVGGYEDEDG